MKYIQAILFDFGGTLDSDGYDWPIRFHQLISKRIGSFDYKNFLSFVRKAADEMTAMPDTINLDMDQTAIRLCQGIHRQMTDNWSVDDVTEEFIDDARRHLLRNRDTLARLANRFKLGCVSNNWGNVAGWCRQYNLEEFFTVIIDSTLVNSVKPEPEIFHKALAQLDIPAAACMYVGDNFQCDVIGSHNVGMRPVWIKSPQACTIAAGCFVDGQNNVKPENINPITISSLPEILQL